jgi:hypothetical protein
MTRLPLILAAILAASGMAYAATITNSPGYIVRAQYTYDFNKDDPFKTKFFCEIAAKWRVQRDLSELEGGWVKSVDCVAAETNR